LYSVSSLSWQHSCGAFVDLAFQAHEASRGSQVQLALKV